MSPDKPIILVDDGVIYGVLDAQAPGNPNRHERRKRAALRHRGHPNRKRLRRLESDQIRYSKKLVADDLTDTT